MSTLNSSKDISDLIGSQLVALDDKAVLLWHMSLLSTDSATQAVMAVAIEMANSIPVNRTEAEDVFWLKFLT